MSRFNQNFSLYLFNRSIVTAAHCVSGFEIERMSVLAGTPSLKDEQNGQRSQVDNCVIHPEYVELNNSDIAVCRLKTPLTFGDNVSSITIGKEYVGGGVDCLLTGWGYTWPVRGAPLPNDLQKANLPTLTNEDCNEKGHNVGPKEICTLSRIGQG
jgi:trypsin